MSKLKSLFKKESSLPENREVYGKSQAEETPSAPAGLWVKCTRCGQLIYKEDVVKNHYICPKCSGYFRIKAKTRIRMITDPHTFEKWFTDLETRDPLRYPGYLEKLDQLQERFRLDEAVRIGKAQIGGIDVVIGVIDSRFLMGSMGYVVGEKITRAFEEATRLRLPVILFCCSGGARMQEGITSLMQMAKTSAAVKAHSKEGLLYIPVLTDPTTGGVTASFAMLGDIILAEPGALIGFAGPRVIAQTIGQKLPEGFQRAEFLKEHGMVDEVVPREKQREYLLNLLQIHKRGEELVHSDAQKEKPQKFEPSDETTAWNRVLRARDNSRPSSMDYIETIFHNFTEFHGDRTFGDDGAIVGGVAYLENTPVTVIGVQKGKSTKENIIRRFGMPSPEGYRKALRLMKQAEKFGRPVICFIDTPGAFCGIEAEERGQGEAIAKNIMEMSDLAVPILSIVIGEGGSGGALALGVGNEVWMMENATYSILSPEGFATILWKDSKRASEAAETMKITAKDLYDMKIVERIIPERVPAAGDTLIELSSYMKEHMITFLEQNSSKSKEELAEERYQRFRSM